MVGARIAPRLGVRVSFEANDLGPQHMMRRMPVRRADDASPRGQAKSLRCSEPTCEDVRTYAAGGDKS